MLGGDDNATGNNKEFLEFFESKGQGRAQSQSETPAACNTVPPFVTTTTATRKCLTSNEPFLLHDLDCQCVTQTVSHSSKAMVCV